MWDVSVVAQYNSEKIVFEIVYKNFNMITSDDTLNLQK